MFSFRFKYLRIFISVNMIFNMKRHKIRKPGAGNELEIMMNVATENMSKQEKIVVVEGNKLTLSRHRKNPFQTCSPLRTVQFSVG